MLRKGISETEPSSFLVADFKAFQYIFRFVVSITDGTALRSSCEMQ